MRIFPIAALMVSLCLSCRLAAQKEKDRAFDLASPGGATTVSITTGAGGLWWSVRHRGQDVLVPSAIALQLQDGEMLDGRLAPVKATRESSHAVMVPLHYKKDTIHDDYAQLTLFFAKAGYGVIFRAYDDGAAYRFFTRRKDSLTIRSETADFNFPADEKAWIPYVNDPSPVIYTTSF